MFGVYLCHTQSTDASAARNAREYWTLLPVYKCERARVCACLCAGVCVFVCVHTCMHTTKTKIMISISSIIIIITKNKNKNDGDESESNSNLLSLLLSSHYHYHLLLLIALLSLSSLSVNQWSVLLKVYINNYNANIILYNNVIYFKRSLQCKQYHWLINNR